MLITSLSSPGNKANAAAVWSGRIEVIGVAAGMGNAATVNDVTAGFALPSLLCSVATIVIVAKRSREYSMSAPLVVHFALCICAADVLRSAWATLAFLPPAVQGSFVYAHTTCVLVGVLGQLGMVCTVMWYAICVWMCARLALGSTMGAVKRSMGTHHLASWGVGALMTVLPVATSQFGKIDSGGQICWINGWDSPYRLTLLVPLGCALLLAIALLLFVGIQAAAVEASQPLKRLIGYVVIFVVGWTPMLVTMAAEMSSNQPASQLLRGVSLATMSACGVLNCVRLLTTEPFKQILYRRMSSHVRMANVATVNDSSISESEPMRLYFNKRGPGDEL